MTSPVRHGSVLCVTHLTPADFDRSHCTALRQRHMTGGLCFTAGCMCSGSSTEPRRPHPCNRAHAPIQGTSRRASRTHGQMRSSSSSHALKRRSSWPSAGEGAWQTAFAAVTLTVMAVTLQWPVKGIFRQHNGSVVCCHSFYPTSRMDDASIPAHLCRRGRLADGRH